MSALPQRIGERLLAQKLIRAEDLDRALELQHAHGGRLGSLLVRLGALSEESLYAQLAEQTGLDLVGADEIPIAYIEARF